VLREAKARRRAKERQHGRSKGQTAIGHKHSFLAATYVDSVDHKDGERTTFATNRAFEHMGLRSLSDGARRVIRGMPRWAEALRSEIKKHRNFLDKNGRKAAIVKIAIGRLTRNRLIDVAFVTSSEIV